MPDPTPQASPPGLTTEPTTPTPTEPPAPAPAPPAEPTKPAEPPAATPFEPSQLKLPEGVSFDEKAVADFAGLINDEKLSRGELAQKLIDVQVAHNQAAAEKAVQAWSDMQEQWQKEIREDPELGGANFEQTIATIDKLLDKYKATPELRDAFKMTGAGNNPHIVRFFHAVAKDLSEAGPVSGSPGVSKGLSAEKLYPTMGSNK